MLRGSFHDFAVLRVRCDLLNDPLVPDDAHTRRLAFMHALHEQQQSLQQHQTPKQQQVRKQQRLLLHHPLLRQQHQALSASAHQMRLLYGFSSSSGTSFLTFRRRSQASIRTVRVLPCLDPNSESPPKHSFVSAYLFHNILLLIHSKLLFSFNIHKQPSFYPNFDGSSSQLVRVNKKKQRGSINQFVSFIQSISEGSSSQLVRVNQSTCIFPIKSKSEGQSNQAVRVHPAN